VIVGGAPVVASWDASAGSLGIFRRKNSKPVRDTVDIHGRVGGKGGPPLERLNTVKSGAFWIVFCQLLSQLSRESRVSTRAESIIVGAGPFPAIIRRITVELE
jgi:hypothetical protein